MKTQTAIKGWIARDDDRITEANFFYNKPKMDDWFWEDKGLLGDYFIDVHIPTNIVKRGECKRCRIIIEIED